jgi:hypothetical protein
MVVHPKPAPQTDELVRKPLARIHLIDSDSGINSFYAILLVMQDLVSDLKRGRQAFCLVVDVVHTGKRDTTHSVFTNAEWTSC